MMKKLFYFISVLFFLVGCSDDNDSNQLQEPDINILDVIPDKVRATIDTEEDAQDQSRAHVDGVNILWNNGDAISFFGAKTSNSKYVFTGEDGVKLADFQAKNINLDEESEHLFSHAVYPYSSHVTTSVGRSTHRLTVNFPTLQTYAPNSFGRDANIMVAAGNDLTDEELYFRNACGYLVINIYSPNSLRVQTIELTALDEENKLSGTGDIYVWNNAAPVIEMSSGSNAINMVSLDCSNDGNYVALGADAANATAFWFALPPVKMEKGFRMTVTDDKGGQFVAETKKEVDVVRNEVLPMEAIEFIPETHKLTYTTKDGKKLEFNEANNPNPFDAEIYSHEYDEAAGCYVIVTKTPLTTIKEAAFKESGITSITFPVGLTTIEAEAFEDSELESLTIPGSVTKIGKSAVFSCANLTSVTFEPSPTEEPLHISRGVTFSSSFGPFYGGKLQQLTLDRELIYPDASNDYSTGLFSREGYLKDVVLGPQVKKLHTYMFNDTSIDIITIPGTVNQIESNAFMGCRDLSVITFEPSPTQTPLDIVHGKDGTFYNGPFYDSPLRIIDLNRELVYRNLSGSHFYPGKASHGLFSYRSSVAGCEITLGEQLETISPYMFAYTAATSITIPDGVKYIQDYAFSDAEINSITISGTVKEIGNFVFDDCENLSKVTFENGSEPLQIGFQPGTNERGPFYDSPLTYIYLDRELKLSNEYAEALDQWDEGVFAYHYWDDDNITTQVSMQGNVKTIHPYMFSAVRMTSCWIPKEVTTIGNGAFYYCEHMGYITMGGATPPALGEDVFEDCDELKKVFVPTGSIDNYKNNTDWNAWGFTFQEYE